MKPTSDNLPPPKLIAGSSNSRLWMWILVALAIHVVVIGATSVGYLRDNIFDPQGAEARRAAEAAKLAPPVKAATPAGTPAPAGTGAATQTTAGSATKPETEKDALEQKKTTPVVKSLTDTAKPNEVPKKPDELGIGLDETNPK